MPLRELEILPSVHVGFVGGEISNRRAIKGEASPIEARLIHCGVEIPESSLAVTCHQGVSNTVDILG